MSYVRQEFIDQKTTLKAEHLRKLEDGIIEAINLASMSNTGNSSNTEVTIPDYWKEHIDAKIAEINAINEEQGGDADTFVFLTDTHFPGNSGNSFNLIKYIMNHTSVNKLFISGDLIEGNQGNAADVALLRTINKQLKGIKVFPVRGNHDAHESDITDGQWYDTITRDLEDYCEVSDKIYYYHDNKAQKIRYIFADSIWGYGKYASNDYLISDEQLAWIKERILELESDWSVLIVKHHLWSIGNEGKLNAEGQKIVDYLNTFYSEAKCSVVGIFAGHSHSDHLVNAAPGYILTSTKGDATQVSGHQAKTTKEQCFDVVSLNPKTGTVKTVRIGTRGGSNREFRYAVNGVLSLTGISMDYNTLAVGPSNTRTLTAVLNPNNATAKDIDWSIESGEQYVTITPDGLTCKVTGIKNGVAVIKASAENGKHVATCEITVKEIIVEDITDEFSFTEGKMIYANNGGDAAHSGWIASDYTDISKYSVLEIKMSKTASTTTSTGLAFYDADKKYISGIAHTDGVATYGTMIKELQVPANAVYIRTTYWSTNHSNYSTEFGDFYCRGIV